MADSQTAHEGTYRARGTVRAAVSLISLLILVGSMFPAQAKAGVLSDFLASIKNGMAKQAEAASATGNVQTMTLLRPAMNIDPTAARGGGEITIVDDSALMPEEGPSGTIADIEKPKNATISVYVVREGDTLSNVGKLFGVSPNTILWANDIPRGTALQVGQTLTILPVTGVKYTVKKGDTLAGIAKRFGADSAEIANFNGIDNTTLTAGDEIIIPDGEVPATAPITSKPGSEPAHNVGPVGTLEQIGYYLRPLIGGRKTQGIHGFNGVDLGGLPIGSSIMASATGDVIVAKQGGWNGGYGSYVVIQHPNGSQTLYGHLSKVNVYAGEHVVQGQVIGALGNTGKSTGPHLHFEIRNGIRNPF